MRSVKSATQRHVVLHQQHRVAPGVLHGPQGFGQSLCLVAVQSRRRLVEQQDLGAGHQRPPGLHQPALAQAERLDRLVGQLGDAQQFQHLVAGGDLFRPRTAPADSGPSRRRRCRCGCAQQSTGAPRTVVSLNSSTRWKVRPIPARARRWTGHPPTSTPLSRTRPASGPQNPEQAVEQRGLAGAIWPDQAHPLPSTHADAHVVEGADAREGHAQPHGFKQATHTTAPSRASSQRLMRADARRLPCSTRPSGWRANCIAIRPEQHQPPASPRWGRSRAGGRRPAGSRPAARPGRISGANSAKAAPAWMAPSTVRAPKATTITSQNSVFNALKLTE